jgi:hypothetical protein
MSECCEKKPTKQEFLEAKASNFKKYIESFSPDTEVKEYMDNFNPATLVETISSTIVPLAQLKQLDSSADELMKHLNIPEPSKPDVKKKIVAYLQMFNDVLLQ